MQLEGLEVVVKARVECELPPDTWCHVTCQQHQVQTMGAWMGHRLVVTVAGCASLSPSLFDPGEWMGAST